VLPLLQRCGGSIEAIASKINAHVSGGLLDSDDASSRRSAFGENRLPQKPMVMHPLDMQSSKSLVTFAHAMFAISVVA
jgi:hypothetical protein